MIMSHQRQTPGPCGEAFANGNRSFDVEITRPFSRWSSSFEKIDDIPEKKLVTLGDTQKFQLS
jgi:hypothetical protein